MSAGDNPRFVVTSLDAPTPQMLYEDLYCARGNCENAIKAVGYPRKAGHPTLSTTSRHDLIALPRSRQVFDLR